MNEERILEFINSKIDSGIFTGASLIFGKPYQKILEINAGNLGKSIYSPVTGSTLFDLQSITKSVVTTPLLLKLINDRRIQLDATVDKFLPAASDAIQKLTFKELATHTSGLSDNDFEGIYEKPEDLWKAMLAHTLIYKREAEIEYSDIGYRILGKALENIFQVDLHTAAKNLIWAPMGLTSMTYLPQVLTSVAATPNAHGFIDDEQVHFLGGVLGCDGVFSNASDLFIFMSNLYSNESSFGNHTLGSIVKNSVPSKRGPTSFFESLAFGSKNLGWEINPEGFSYSGKFQNGKVIEKAGGAGTFIWLDTESGYMMVYLTNHGKPKPFDEIMWNKLVDKTAPHKISDMIYQMI